MMYNEIQNSLQNINYPKLRFFIEKDILWTHFYSHIAHIRQECNVYFRFLYNCNLFCNRQIIIVVIIIIIITITNFS